MYNNVPEQKHKHKCPECDTVWEHPDQCFGSEEDHVCPECGCIETYHPGGTFSKYFGDQPADYQFVYWGQYERVAA